MIEDIWWETLATGQELASRSDESSRRAGVSRLYLGFYTLARLALIRQRIRPPATVNTHVWVWQQFRNQARQRLGDIGRRGQELRTWRNRADYEARMPDIELRCQIAIELVAEYGVDLRVLFGYPDTLSESNSGRQP